MPVTSLCFAQQADLKLKNNNSADKIIQTYCNSDFNGARLSNKNYKESGIATIIIPGEGAEPGWDTATIVSGFRLLSTSPSGKGVKITVRYNVIGELDGASEFTKDNKTEDYVFHVKQVNNAWKLVNPDDLPPHISAETAIRHLEHLVKVQKEMRAENLKTIKKLKEIKK